MKPYFEDGSITIYCGDCRDILPTLGPVDHVITDPPYENEAHTRGRRAYSGASSVEFRKGIAEERPISFSPMDETTRAFVAVQTARICNRWVMTFCQVEAVHLWRAELERAGIRYTRTQIWVKPDAAPQFTGDRPAMAFECIVTGYVQGRMAWNGGGARGLYSHMTVKDGKHETQKPIALMLELVEVFTDPGDLILDPFMGSGTTLVACKRLARRAIGIELSEKYCEIAANRLRQAVLPLVYEPQATQADLLGENIA